MDEAWCKMVALSMGIDTDRIPLPTRASQAEASQAKEFSSEDPMDEMHNFFNQAKALGEGGPPEVYRATLPYPFFTRTGYVNGFEHNKKKMADSKASSKHILNRSTQPAMEHGVAPPSLSNLERTTLQGVARKVNHIHTDKVIFVKTVHSPYRVIGANTLVQDEAGDCMLLALYNYVRKDEEPEEVLPEGTLLAILAPFMKNAEDDKTRNLMLRCDNPQCILKFDFEEAWRAAMNGKDHPIEKVSPSLLRKMGNDAFGNGKYSEAAWFYSRALRNPAIIYEDTLACLSNRAEVYLRQEKWELAEADARNVRRHDGNHVKATFRLTKALTRLGQLSEAQTLASLHQSERSFQELNSDLQRLGQEQNGHYDLLAMTKEAKVTIPLTKYHADFVSTKIAMGVEISWPSNIGRASTTTSTYRGCRALNDIAEHELLLASKSFAFVAFVPENVSLQVNPYTNVMEDNKKIQQAAEVIDKLWSRPCLGREFYKLSAGNEFASPVPQSNLEQIDIPRIRCILTSNAFSQVTESQELRMAWEGLQLEEQKQRLLTESERRAIGERYGPKVNGSGLWLKESMFNHSCTPNCSWSQIGDHMFIRSTRPIAAGEELCIVYTSVEASFAERTKTFQHWIRPHEGFECACELCQLLRSDSKLKKMEALVCKAFKEAGAQVALMGIPMAKAADRVMSLEKRDEVLRAYAKVPLRLQYPTVSNVEIMNGTCKSVQGDKQGALACYERAAAIGYAARGGTTCRHAKDLWRIVGASMACGKMQQAMETLASIWHGTYWEGIPLHEIRPAFTALTLRYTLPWWDDRQNASLQQQMLAMVAEICTTERRKPSSASQGGKAQKARTTKIKGKRRGKK